MWSISYSILANRLVKSSGEDSKISRILDHDTRSKWSLIINILVFIILYFYPPIVLIGRLLISILWIKPYADKIY